MWSEATERLRERYHASYGFTQGVWVSAFTWGWSVTLPWLGRAMIWRKNDPEPPELNT